MVTSLNILKNTYFHNLTDVKRAATEVVLKTKAKITAMIFLELAQRL